MENLAESEQLALCWFAVKPFVRRAVLVGREPQELLSVAWLALADAATRFDATRAEKFTTFALHRMRYAILDELSGPHRKLERQARATVSLYEPGASDARLSAAERADTLRHERALPLPPDRNTPAPDAYADVAVYLARLPARKRALAEAVLTYGLGPDTEPQIHAACPWWSVMTFRLHRAQVTRQLRALLRDAA